jgi:GAF domain-containing protein
VSPPTAPATPALRLSELDRLATGLLAATSEEELLGAAGATLHSAFDVDWVSVALRSSDGHRFRLLPLDRNGRRPRSGTDLPADLLAAARVIERGPLLHEADLRRSSHPDLAGLADNGLVTAVVLALEVGGQALGALTLARSEGSDFDENDVLVLLQAGALLASAIRHRRTVVAAERAETERDKAGLVLGRRVSELSALQRMVAVIEAGDPAEAVQVITSEIASMRGIELCRITAIAPGAGGDEIGGLPSGGCFDGTAGLVVVAESSVHGAAFQDRAAPAAAGSPDALVVQNRRPVVWRRPGPEDRAEIGALLRLGVTSVFALPIMSGGAPIGALAAGSTGGHRLVTDEHIVAADIVCRALARSIGSAERLRAAAVPRRESVDL